MTDMNSIQTRDALKVTGATDTAPTEPQGGYQAMSGADVLALAFARRDQMGADGVTVEELQRAIDQGTATLERDRHGFALIQIERKADGTCVPHLWLLWIDESQRGQGHGRRFVRALVRKYSTAHHMTVCCVGAKRRKFLRSSRFCGGSERRGASTHDHQPRLLSVIAEVR